MIFSKKFIFCCRPKGRQIFISLLAFVSFRAVGIKNKDADFSARNLLFRTAFGLSFGKDRLLLVSHLPKSAPLKAPRGRSLSQALRLRVVVLLSG